jgi:hypothetical protein
MVLEGVWLIVDRPKKKSWGFKGAQPPFKKEKKAGV